MRGVVHSSALALCAPGICYCCTDLGVEVEGKPSKVCHSMRCAKKQDIGLPSAYQLPDQLGGIVE